MSSTLYVSRAGAKKKRLVIIRFPTSPPPPPSAVPAWENDPSFWSLALPGASRDLHMLRGGRGGQRGGGG
eukprot:746496-Hanusia_phi.AAC.1